MGKYQPRAVLVVGLGRFGSALADTLVGLGHEVLGVDTDPKIVQQMSATLTHVVEADTTDEETLRQLGATEFEIAVVAIGADIQASILTTSLLAELGVARIWAKAMSRQHGNILRRVGAHEVIFPEHDMGERVAHMLGGRMVDYFELGGDHVLVEARPPAEIVGRPLAETKVRGRYGVTIVCVKKAGQDFDYARPDTVVEAQDLILVLGRTHAAVRFAEGAPG